MKRWRNNQHIQKIRDMGCVVCLQPSEAHHLIGYGVSGMGLKAKDTFSFPLCHLHHMELHDHGVGTWEKKYGSQWRYVAQALARVVEA